MRWFSDKGAGPVETRVEPTFTASAPAQNDLTRPEAWGIVSGGGTAAGKVVTEGTSLSLPAVLQALRILTGVFAMTPLIYYRKGPNGRDRATDSPLYKLLQRDPNEVQTPFAFKELLLSDVVIRGRFNAWISRRTVDYMPVALTRLDPNRVKVLSSFDKAIGYRLFFDAQLPDNTSGRYTASEILHITGMSRDGLTGLDVMSYMREALAGALATQDYSNRFFANDAKPSVILTTPKTMAPEVKVQIRQDWDNAARGSNRAHGTVVADQGLDAKVLSFDNDKSQLIGTRTFQVLDVARMFGIPPHLIFELSKATFANIEQQSLEFVIYHLGPHFERVSQAFTKAFADDDCYYEFLPDAILKSDSKARWEAYKAGREIGVLNADEIRDKENLNHIGGRAGSTYLWPLNFGPAGEPRAPANAN